MGLTDITRDSVLAAVAECDQLGRDAFLASYGFERARKYVLLHDGKTYDSKALVGAAHRHATGDTLPAAAFSGGERTVVARLTALGFDVRDTSGLTRAGDRGTIGEAPGVEEGQTFADRQETYDRGRSPRSPSRNRRDCPDRGRVNRCLGRLRRRRRLQLADHLYGSWWPGRRRTPDRQPVLG